MNYRFVVEDEVMDVFIRSSSLQRERLLKLFQQMADATSMVGAFGIGMMVRSKKCES